MPPAHLVCLCLTLSIAAAPQDASDRFTINVVDLRSAFAEADLALTEQPNVDVNLVNRLIDGGLRQFLVGNRIGAVRSVRTVALQLRYGSSLPAEADVLASLKVVMDPPVFVAGSDSPVIARIGSMFATAPKEDQTVDHSMLLRMIGPDGAVVTQQGFRGEPLDNNLVRADLTLVFASDELLAGRYTVEVETSGGLAAPLGYWYVLEEPLDEARRDLLARLDAIEADPVRRARVRFQAIVSARARAERLSEEVIRMTLLHTRYDPQRMLEEVRREVGILEQGGNPYAGVTGHLWRVVRIGELEVPVRFYVPEAAEEGQPLPLVIAIQGVTGDESLFPDVYGGGVLTQLADEHSFIVAAPDVMQLGMNPSTFEYLYSEVAANYDVDQSRVYLIGHASGTQAVDVYCKQRTDRIAAACMISSDGLLNPRATFPPLLLVHGWMDTITEAEKVEKLTRVAQSRGIPATFLGVEHYGHVLVVGHALPTIVDWLLQFPPNP